MDSISPNIFVKDINETIKFYQGIGFETVMTVPEEGDFVWVMMSCATEFSIQDINGYILTFAEDEK